MFSEEERARLRFDLANANVQSIGRAQGRYATALLIYNCLVWGFPFIGGKGAVFHLDGLDLSVDGLWNITPFVMLVLVLVYIGSLTAFGPALTQLRETEKKLFGSENWPLASIDTHKNIIDYLACLQIRPWGKTSKPTDDVPNHWWQRLYHLILPIVFFGSAFTAYWAIHRQYTFGSSNSAALTFDYSCLGAQILFSGRPVWRCTARFFGAKSTSNVYH